jgi:hypothetical protein
MAIPDPGPGLLGRQSERAALDLVVGSVRAGESQTLVLRGEAGVGKSALLGYVAERAADCRILHAVGVEAEMELRMRGCTSCVLRCSTGSSRCRRRNVTRWPRHSACGPARHRIASWSVWPC